jgi:hypothetical protein
MMIVRVANMAIVYSYDRKSSRYGKRPHLGGLLLHQQLRSITVSITVVIVIAVVILTVTVMLMFNDHWCGLYLNRLCWHNHGSLRGVAPVMQDNTLAITNANPVNWFNYAAGHN